MIILHATHQVGVKITWLLGLQDCCQETDEKMRLEGSLYLLFNILPLLRHIQREQRSELDVETNIRGTI